MAIESTRYRNAQTLVKQAGNQSRFAEKMNMSRQQASHIIGEKPVKPIGSRLARRMEKVFEMPAGWLDEDHTPFLHGRTAGLDEVDIPHIDITRAGGAATGYAEDDSVRSMRMSKSWLRQHVQATAWDYLGVSEMHGDSMAGTLRDGSLLLVDRGVSSIKDDAVYMLSQGGQAFIRRVQRKLDGGVLIKCDNQAYDATELSDKERDKLTVVGKVVLSWDTKPM